MTTDNLAYTPGLGASVATDYVGGVHVQRVKIQHGADGFASDVSRDDPLPVTTSSRVVDVTLSLDTSAYTAGDVLADTQAVSNAMRIINGNGLLNSVIVIDEDDQNQPLDLVFLSANVSLGTENAAASITDANARNILGIVRINSYDWIGLGGVGIATITGLTLGLQAASGTPDIYIAAITRGAPTHTASGIRIRLNIITD